MNENMLGPITNRFERRAAIVHIGLQTAVMAEVKLIVELVHDADMQMATVVECCAW